MQYRSKVMTLKHTQHTSLKVRYYDSLVNTLIRVSFAYLKLRIEYEDEGCEIKGGRQGCI